MLCGKMAVDMFLIIFMLVKVEEHETDHRSCSGCCCVPLYFDISLLWGTSMAELCIADIWWIL